MGASGIVFKGKVSGLEAVDVAIKMLSERHISFDWGSFRKEVAVGSLLRHENIVYCFGASVEGPDLFIVHEFVHQVS